MKSKTIFTMLLNSIDIRKLYKDNYPSLTKNEM